MSIAAGYHTPSTQNSTPRFSTARIGSVTGGASGAVVSVVTGGHSFRGTRRAVAEPVPSGDTSLGETGGVDPTTLTFRPRSGRWMSGVVAALALYGIGSLAVAIVRGRWEALRDAGHLDDPRLERDRPRSHLHWGTVALLATLAALTVAALAGIHQR